MMKSSTHTPSWQRLVGLESRDTVVSWHRRLRGRELSARRAKEITSAAKQAREFFRNALGSDHSVRPLLTFYGVAGLSRALLLLLRQSGGEETVQQSHGLQAINWSYVMTGDIAASLSNIGSLGIGTCGGLFTSLVQETSNTICIHVRSSGVDWRLPYSSAASNVSVKLDDLLLRLPDLHHEHQQRGPKGLYASVNEMTFSQEAGFAAKVRRAQLEAFSASYSSAGYSISCDGDWCDVRCDASTFEGSLPQFIHTYVHKTFGSIPSLHLAKPFDGNHRYSQLAVTYMLSYCLGMLCRYFPTHWVALMSGEKGDAFWPSVSAGQRYIESCYPELVDEFLHDALRQAELSRMAPSTAGALDGA